MLPCPRSPLAVRPRHAQLAPNTAQVQNAHPRRRFPATEHEIAPRGNGTSINPALHTLVASKLERKRGEEKPREGVMEQPRVRDGSRYCMKGRTPYGPPWPCSPACAEMNNYRKIIILANYSLSLSPSLLLPLPTSIYLFLS